VSRHLKVGIYGGTFDPPHNAHLSLARFAVHELALDYLYIVPAKGHALKKNDTITPAGIRFEMVEAAFRNERKIRISRIELDGPDTSYTVETIDRFQQYEQLRDPEYYYLIGADNLQEIHLWKEPERIFRVARVVVLRRPGYQKTPGSFKFGDHVRFLDSPHVDISSTGIRERVRQGKSVGDLVPAEVAVLIKKYQLYRAD